MSIGERIKTKRKQSNLTQTELGKLVNVSSQVISNWERGYSDPSHDDVAMLSLKLNCSTEYLHGISSVKFSSKDVLAAGRENNLTDEDFQLLYELKKHSAIFSDLSSDPEKKVRKLIKLYKAHKFLEKDDEDLSDSVW